jgi:hypothetical protein
MSRDPLASPPPTSGRIADCVRWVQHENRRLQGEVDVMREMLLWAEWSAGAGRTSPRPSPRETS